MDVKKVAVTPTLDQNLPTRPTNKATGAFAGRDVQTVPGSKVRNFLMFLSTKTHFKSALSSLISTVKPNWYGFLLVKQNPLERGGRDMSASVEKDPALKAQLQEYIQRQLRHHGLADKVSAHDFLTSPDKKTCTLAAVNAALSMFNGDARGVSSLTTDYQGPFSDLPGIAQNAIKTDLEEHHAIPRDEVAGIIKKNPDVTALKSVAVCCDCVDTDALWQKVQYIEQDVSLLPAAQQQQIMDRLTEQMKPAEKPEALAKAYLAGNDNKITVFSLSKFKGNPQIHLQFQEAIKKADLSTLTELKPADLSAREKVQFMDMYVSKLGQAGMNSEQAKRMVGEYYDAHRTEPLSQIHASLKHQYSQAWQPITAADEQRLHSLSDEPLEVRCKSFGKPIDIETLVATPGLDASEVDLLKTNRQLHREDMSLSDIETALDVYELKEKSGSVLTAFRGKPLQVMSLLPDTCLDGLQRFAKREMESLNATEEEITENLKMLEECDFAYQFETKLRDILPARLLLPEAYDTLGLPLDADEKALTRTFRKLALKHHPDKHTGTSEENINFHETEFTKYNAVYERLGPAIKLSSEESALFSRPKAIDNKAS